MSSRLEQLLRIWNIHGYVIHVYSIQYGDNPELRYDYKFRKTTEKKWFWAVTTYNSLEWMKDYLIDQILTKYYE
jgi:hypothetical protein